MQGKVLWDSSRAHTSVDVESRAKKIPTHVESAAGIVSLTDGLGFEPCAACGLRNSSELPISQKPLGITARL